VDDANELLRRCQQRDEAALAALVGQFNNRVFRLAMRMLGDAGRAEEAAADSFVKVWSAAKQWRQDADAGTWIYRVAYRTILDHRRRKVKNWIEPSSELIDPKPGPLDKSIQVETDERTSRRVDAAMSELSESDRALVHLYYFEEMSLPQIAEIVDATREVIKTRLARARQRLREVLEEGSE
jgi:RNA polymerase sigma-70 factor (ECF subfamily)